MRHRSLPILALALAFLSAVFLLMPSARAADDDILQGFVAAFGGGDFEAMDKAVAGLAATGDPRAAEILDALDEGRIVSRTDDDTSVTVAEDTGKGLLDPVTRAAVDAPDPGAFDKITINNKIRRAIDAALGGLRLMSPDPARRRAAAEAVFKSREATQIPLLDRAIAAERDASIKQLMVRARAAAILGDNSAGPDERLAAVGVIAELGDQDAIGLLTPLTGESGAVGASAKAAVGHIATSLQLWSVAQNIWYGLSLSSVLLLAAIGLAITFGVMGVINMAHGEMVMIGAYTTYVVQQLIRAHAPGLFDASLPIAIPLAFLVSGLVGIVIERTVIRFLYGRALETLLATWGISLVLQQLVRSVFGPDNMQVGNPSWMSGAFELGLVQVTWSRLWIIVFAAVVFAGLLVVLKNTFFGLTMRAVTQNRGMASAMGIRTPLVDALTFGLGSGIAGIAGVALSQIDNVSPNLGQGYIIDSFMVVVFGGVGNLWGTLVGAATLGIANKFLEPFAGAVLGKIVLLVLIILFIQKRPRGLFALKGRAIEA